MLAETEKAKGAAVKGVGKAGANGVAQDDRIRETKTLSEMGITKDQSSTWQKCANLHPYPLALFKVIY